MDLCCAQLEHFAIVYTDKINPHPCVHEGPYFPFVEKDGRAQIERLKDEGYARRMTKREYRERCLPLNHYWNEMEGHRCQIEAEGKRRPTFPRYPSEWFDPSTIN